MSTRDDDDADGAPLVVNTGAPLSLGSAERCDEETHVPCVVVAAAAAVTPPVPRGRAGCACGEHACDTRLAALRADAADARADAARAAHAAAAAEAALANAVAAHAVAVAERARAAAAAEAPSFCL